MEMHIPLNSHCDHLKVDKEKPLTRRLKPNTAVQYVHACIRLDLSRAPTARPHNIPPVQLCFTVRRALDSAISELFGQLTGASMLGYDLLLCKPKILDQSAEFTCSILLAVTGTHLGHLLTALSLLSTDVGGFHMFGIFPNMAECERDKIVLVAEVIGVHDHLFSVNLDPNFS
ncbi:hypothetical protein D915_000760 [Fasciola hepatica]|uniref:Uncharacterized protein n=1 Tax=Fasciola hepatica TaxID=6192 RepID=A0A4E0RR62_FASHE|nr:hypothetical protein D915_000760 [Fasciola hepatica]